MRAVGRIAIFVVGLFAGFMAAAAVVKRAVPSRGGAESDEVALMAVFDGAKLHSEAKAFRGGSMLAWFGGVDADLRAADLASGARLTVGALFGGIQLIVPESWRVETSIKAVAGGYDIGGEDPADPDAPLLVVDGYALCGGVAVSRKPTPITD